MCFNLVPSFSLYDSYVSVYSTYWNEYGHQTFFYMFFAVMYMYMCVCSTHVSKYGF